MKIIHSLIGKRLDPDAVAALTAIYGRGEIRIQRPSVTVVTTEIALPDRTKTEAAREIPADTAVVETTRF